MPTRFIAHGRVIVREDEVTDDAAARDLLFEKSDNLKLAEKLAAELLLEMKPSDLFTATGITPFTVRNLASGKATRVSKKVLFALQRCMNRLHEPERVASPDRFDEEERIEESPAGGSRTESHVPAAPATTPARPSVTPATTTPAQSATPVAATKSSPTTKSSPATKTSLPERSDAAREVSFPQLDFVPLHELVDIAALEMELVKDEERLARMRRLLELSDTLRF